MTDDALRALRDAVKAGERPWREPCDSEWPYARFALDAFHGSLDAAHALHKAVLPGWAWDLSDNCEVQLWPPSLDFAGKVPIFGRADTPARAWLLAILEALIAQQGAGKGGE
jgi:hypothetical protein